MYYTYMLRCQGPSGSVSLYTGHSNSVERRFDEHTSGKGARFTKHKDVELVFFQSFTTRKAAMQRELELKRMEKNGKEALIDDVLVNELFKARLAGLVRGEDHVM